MYHYDVNFIRGHPVKDCIAATLKDARGRLHRLFGRVGIPPNVWVMNNKCSEDLVTALGKNNTKYQLVTSYFQ